MLNIFNNEAIDKLKTFLSSLKKKQDDYGSQIKKLESTNSKLVFSSKVLKFEFSIGNAGYPLLVWWLGDVERYMLRCTGTTIDLVYVSPENQLSTLWQK